jgi:hypothetical protein
MAAGTTRDIVLRLEGVVNEILKVVDKLDKSVNGNGTPGLKNVCQELGTRIGDIEKRHSSEDANVQKRETRAWDVRKGMLLLAVGQVLTFGGLVIAVWMGFR